MNLIFKAATTMLPRVTCILVLLILIFQVNGIQASDGLIVNVGRVVFRPGDIVRASVPVSVCESDGAAVPGLGRQDFEIRENGGAAFYPMSVTPFIETEKKLVYLILMDLAADSPTSLTYMRKAVSKFLLDLGYKYPGLVMSYVESPRVITQWRDSPKRMAEAVVRQKPVEGLPCLVDGIMHGLARLVELSAESDERFEKPVLILLTDGRDRGSLFSFEAAKTKVLESGADLFAICYGPKRETTDELTLLAAKTAGTALFAADPDELTEKMDIIIDRLKNLYILTYNSYLADPHNQAYNLEVRVHTEDRIGMNAQSYITPLLKSKSRSQIFGALSIGALIFILLVGGLIGRWVLNRKKEESEKTAI